jgi:hypothetical protein
MKNAIINLPDDDIVCFIDAYDVLAFANTQEILEKFKGMNCNIALSGELNCYPTKNINKYNDIYKGEKLPSNFKYVNSGGYIGYKKSIIDLYDWKSLEEIHEICKVGGDQTYFTEYFLEFANNPVVNIKIDVQQRIFQSMNKIEFGDFEFINGRIHNKILDQYPCFIHFNEFGFYKMQILNLDNYQREPVLIFFLNKIKMSYNTHIEKINCALPFIMLIDGIPQYSLPQI